MPGSDTDFPTACERPLEIVSSHPEWNAEKKAAILEGNARRLLKI